MQTQYLLPIVLGPMRTLIYLGNLEHVVHITIAISEVS